MYFRHDGEHIDSNGPTALPWTPFFVYFRYDGEHIDSDGPTAPPWIPFFVYFCHDWEHIDSGGPTASPWIQFEVTLKDEMSQPLADANLMHDVLSRKAVTGILHF
jgi:hypothetical protein